MLLPWKSARKILLAAVLASMVAGQTGRADTIGVMAAFQPELDALEALALPKGAKLKAAEINGQIFKECTIRGHRVIFFLSGISMVNAAMTTQLAIDRFGLDRILFSGIAGGINPSLQPGDVIIPDRWIHQAESVWVNPDPKRPGRFIFPGWFKPERPNYGVMFPANVSVVREGDAGPKQMASFPVSPELLSIARKVTDDLRLPGGRGKHARILIGGPGMAGPVFLDNREYREYAYKTWKVNGHDMESTAIAQVAYANRKPVLVVRGLSDLAGGQHGVNEEEIFLKVASENAAAVTGRILQNLLQAK